MAILVAEVGSRDVGAIELHIDGEYLVVRAHWPFDTSTDEWIDLSARVPISSLHRTTKDGLELFTAHADVDTVEFLHYPDDTILVTINGRNTTGPVRAQIQLPAPEGRQVRSHLGHLQEDDAH